MIPPEKTVFFFLLACPSLTNVVHLTSPHLTPVRTFPLPSPPSPNGTPIIPA